MNFSWLPISGLFWRNEYRFSSFSKADLPVYYRGGSTDVAWRSTSNSYEQSVLSSLVWRFNWH